MKEYKYKDNVFTFEGSLSLEETGQWCAPWRVDFKRLHLYPFLKDSVAKECSGVRLSFMTDSESILLSLEEVIEGMRLDLFINDQFVEQIEVTSNEIRFQSLDEGMKKIEIWLDQRFPFKLKSIFLEESANVSKIPDTKKHWIHYGSSISHSRAGNSPSTIWTAMTAQKKNLHLTNLGFDGNCVLEPMVGRLIRDIKADLISLKLGINIYHGKLTERTFVPAAIGLIELIREKHSHTPIYLISPIFSPDREANKGESGMSLQDIRAHLKDIVNTFQSYGDENLHYIDGLKILGEKEKSYLPDDLHPNGEGQYVVAENFLREVFKEEL